MRLASTLGVLAATFGYLAGLFALRPFDRVNAGMDRAFGALPAWTQVEEMYRDRATQELSHGDAPAESFRALETAWAAHPGVARVILMGNSQTQMTSLAKGEAPPTGPEKTYTDLMADAYRREGSPKLFYRLSAGALSYQEMLWYAAYLATRPAIRPNLLLVQLNYQNFSNGGVRPGMWSLLSDEAFRRAADQFARRGRPYSGAFAEAIDRPAPGKHAGDGPSTGYRIETAFRKELDRIPGFAGRAALKRSFALMLLRSRSYLLHMEPASRRSLSGVRVQASRAALEDLAELSGRAGFRVVLFQAPTNPAVPLYGTEADESSYHAYTASLASHYGLTLLDLEHSIPANDWGMSLNVPDPLHLGREGHRLLAKLILAGLERNGI